MKKDIYLLAVAGGHGTRMGTSVPKQFLTLCGKPILRRTIEKFILAEPAIKVVTVLPENYISIWKDICLKTGFIYPQKIVAGGITRYHSVKNALNKIPDGAIVAIHDGVRPHISAKLIQTMFEHMSQNDDIKALVPILPSVDTLIPIRIEKNAQNEDVYERIEGKTVNRSEVYSVQTPQIFLSEAIKEAYNFNAYDTSFTDDASVAIRHNIPINYCLGERFNIKLTAPDDILLSEVLLKSGLI